MDLLPLLMVSTGAVIALGLVLFAFAGPSPQRAQARRIAAMRERHGDSATVAEAQMRRITAGREQTRTDLAFGRLLPNPAQLAPNERVERIRRIQMNDLENLPFFLVAGFLYILTQPSLLLAQWLLYGYVVSRLLHFAAYFTGQIHEIRAACWTVGSLILIFMTVRTLLAALGV